MIVVTHGEVRRGAGLAAVTWVAAAGMIPVDSVAAHAFEFRVYGVHQQPPARH